MNNLAKCKPSEFMRQTLRIRKAVANWLDLTNITKIRKKVPALKPITKDMDDATLAAVQEENRKLLSEQADKNFSAILDSILEDHPDETIELMALLCFVEPADVDDYTMEEYLESLTEMMSNKAVIGFFTSLLQLEQMSTSRALKR